MGHAKARARSMLYLNDNYQERDIDLYLQHIRSLGKSVDTTKERAIRSRVTAAELYFSSGTNTLVATIDL